MKFKKAFVALIGVALVGGVFGTALPAQAESVNYDSWIEDGDPAPFHTTEGLVFYKGASINFGTVAEGKATDLADLSGLTGLAYTVKDSNGYAPSYQIGIAGGDKEVTYARLVWEPYQQQTSPGDKKGTYTNVQEGVWWAANVWVKNPDQSDPTKPAVKTTPFTGGADGSQSKPQPLSFFVDYFGDSTKVAFFGIKQGTTTEATSTVTHLEFQGKTVPLGDVDTTPYDSADITEATAPLNAELTDVKNQLSQTQAALTAANGSTSANQAMVTATRNSLYAEQAHRGTIAGTKKVGKTVTAKLIHPVPGATMTYQWYVGGKAVKKATKPTLRLTRSFAGKSLAVKLTTTWIDAARVSHTARTTVKYVHSAPIKK